MGRTQRVGWTEFRRQHSIILYLSDHIISNRNNRAATCTDNNSAHRNINRNSYWRNLYSEFYGERKILGSFWCYDAMSAPRISVEVGGGECSRAVKKLVKMQAPTWGVRCAIPYDTQLLAL